MDVIWILLGLLLGLLSIQYMKLRQAAALLPPGPTPLPIFGNLLTIKFQFHHKTLMKLSEIYGNIMTIWVGQSPAIVVTGYEAVKQCLIDNAEQVSNRPTTPYFKYYAEERGIIFSNGENWKLQRRLCLQILRSLGFGKKDLEGRVKVEANQLVEIFSSQKGRATDPNRCIMNAVGNVMSAVNFGHTYSLRDEVFHRLIDATNVVVDFGGTHCGQLYDTFPWLMHRLPGPQQAMYKHLHFFKQCVLQEIRQHQQNPSPEPQDVVDYYLEQISKAKDDPSSTINEDNLITVLMDLVLAGSETVTSTLRWALLYIVVYKDVQVKVQKEIDELVESIENLKYEDRLSMPYTNAVIHEVQRFTSVGPVGLPRQCSQDFTLLGYSIPKGTTIVANLASVLTDHKHWKFPDTFNPSNFLDEEGNFQGNKSFLPFSAGHRICLGEHLARTELFIFFTSLLKTFSFHLPQGVTEVNMSGIFGTTFKPHPYEICAVPR
ncbi:cytochrome P450 2J2-like isoform 1-T1 [Anomaloglossus baeobatrachus]|uniref:cytochrome P450 2J2-like n=1 Tax=Anomaloglossus baeobatrachus TaxID=238106 RepID=UPI003F503B54